MKKDTIVRRKIVFYTIWALCSSWTTAMAGVVWSNMGWEEQSCVVAGILLQWTGMMVAFYDKSAAQQGVNETNSDAPPSTPPPS